jgi:hypothetical protein
MSDIRYKEWINKDCKVSQALKLFIELEDILGELNDYFFKQGDWGNDFEDYKIDVGVTRYEFCKTVEKDETLFDIK